MNDDLRDPLDVRIDEALAEMMAGEPRRVSGATVRAAIEAESRPSAFRVGPWLALAATLVVSFAYVLASRSTSPAGSIDASASHAGATPGMRAETTPASAGGPAVLVAATSVATGSSISRRGAATRVSMREDAPAFPRLDVALLDRPEPLAFGVIEADALVVARMDIAPLLLTTLNHEQEPHP